MEMQFTKIKIPKGEKKAEIHFTRKQDDGKTSKVYEECDGKPHEDFVAAINKLNVHLALLTGYVRPADVKQLDTYTGPNGVIESFKVRGISIGGEDEEQWIIISGHRNLPVTNKAVILNTPLNRFNEDEATRYKFMDDLIEKVEVIKKEALAYMGGKFFIEPQGELVFDGPVKEDEHEVAR